MSGDIRATRLDTAALLPELCRQVPSLVEFLSPGSLGLLAATSVQMRHVMRPLVTKISFKQQDVYVEVEFGVLKDATWSGLQQLSLHTHRLCPQTMPDVVSADLARLTKLDFCHSEMEPQTVSVFGARQMALIAAS